MPMEPDEHDDPYPNEVPATDEERRSVLRRLGYDPNDFTLTVRHPKPNPPLLPTAPLKDAAGNEIVGTYWNDNGTLKIVGGGTADDNVTVPETPRDPLLVERRKTHGDFGDNARISQTLKTLLRQGSAEFSFAHKEALDMIALKLSRILSGQADFKDHWDDIAGYAKLASEACK